MKASAGGLREVCERLGPVFAGPQFSLPVAGAPRSLSQRGPWGRLSLPQNSAPTGPLNDRVSLPNLISRPRLHLRCPLQKLHHHFPSPSPSAPRKSPPLPPLSPFSTRFSLPRYFFTSFPLVSAREHRSTPSMTLHRHATNHHPHLADK